jgi:hypothetical protein
MTRVLTMAERAGARAAERESDETSTDRSATVGPVLDWEGFLSRYFPERRRHDLEAITAYAAYRSSRDVDERSSGTVAPTAEPEPVGVGSRAADTWEDEGGATA